MTYCVCHITLIMCVLWHTDVFLLANFFTLNALLEAVKWLNWILWPHFRALKGPSLIYHPLGSARARNPGVNTEIVANISRRKKEDTYVPNYCAICTLDGELYLLCLVYQQSLTTFRQKSAKSTSQTLGNRTTSYFLSLSSLNNIPACNTHQGRQ